MSPPVWLSKTVRLLETLEYGLNGLNALRNHVSSRIDQFGRQRFQKKHEDVG